MSTVSAYKIIHSATCMLHVLQTGICLYCEVSALTKKVILYLKVIFFFKNDTLKHKLKYCMAYVIFFVVIVSKDGIDT